MKRTFKFSFIAILFLSFISNLHAMELAEEAVAETFGKAAVEGLEEGAMESAAREVASEMGVSVEDIGALPEDTKAAFKSQLKEAFEKGFTIENETFVKTGEFSTAVGKAQEGFATDLSKLGEKQGFSQFEYDAVSKFNPKIKGIEEFPVKSPEEIEAFEVGQKAQFQPTEKPKLTDAETQLKDAEIKLNSAQRDEIYSFETNSPKLEDAQTNLESAQDVYEEKYNAVKQEQEAKVKSAEDKLEKAETPEETQKAKEGLNKAEGAKTEEQRKSALNEYEDAKINKEGTSDAPEKVKKAEADVVDKQKAYDEAKTKGENTEEALKAKKKLEDAQGKLKNEERGAGTKSRLAKAKKDLAEAKKSGDAGKIEKAKAESKSAAEEDRVADEKLTEAEKKLYESGQGDWKFKANQRWENTKSFWKEQVINGVVGGFMFSIPNFIIGPIEAGMQAKADRDTLQSPQRFGDVWMQIPSKLISGKGEPVAKYLYVGLQPSDPSAETVKRDSKADTDTYLQNANMYMSRSDYDEYAQTAITDPRFPDNMIQLNTGFQFYGDGEGNYDWPVIRFLGEVPKGFRGIPLQPHLDKQAEDISRGVSGSAYFEEREIKTGYEGSPVIADQFEGAKNTLAEQDYPGETKGFGSILNNSIQAFANGTYFGDFNVQAFSVLDEASQKTLGISMPGAQPWVAKGVYLYQTEDTSNIKSAKANIAKNPDKAELADKLIEYVVFFDAAKKDFVPLQHPDAAGNPYGFASYQLNPKVKYMLSLYDGTLYEKGKKSKSSNLDIKKIATLILSEAVPQIDAMNKLITEQIQNGPFIVGDQTLTTKKELTDAGVHVYQIKGFLEGGFDDYVIATEGLLATSLPGSPKNFVSLVTSRIYNNQLIPADKKHDGDIRSIAPFVIYKKDDAAAPRVVTGPPSEKNIAKYGTAISTGLKGPIYSLFMDSAINPNKVDQKSIANTEDRSWYADKVGVSVGDATYPLAQPNQWALGDNGPATVIENKVVKQRIGELLQSKESTSAVADLLSAINSSYNSWKKYFQDPEAIKDELGPFVFVDIQPYPIVIRATSSADIKNQNFVYTAPYYPDEYLVLANSKDGSDAQFATQYDDAAPQRYAISLSSGKVYDAQSDGDMVAQIENLAQLLQKVTIKQPKFLPTLLKDIKAAQSVHEKNLAKEQYGPDTFFGPFRFYIDKQDLMAAQYVYADVTNIADPLKIDPKKLMSDAKNFYVGISLTDTSAANVASNWTYGKKLSPNTMYVISLVTGILYDRGGGYQGYIKEFADSVDGNLDIAKGFLDVIFNYLQSTWGKQMRGDLKNIIIKLTQAEYNKLLKEKGEIELAAKKEAEMFAPMDKNTMANLGDQLSYVELLQSFSPVRYLKFEPGTKKYYTVIPADPGPITYIDYNVGDDGKDNGVGMSYDKDGNAFAHLTSWVLENARAYTGVVVKANGTQELDIAADHPSIPMKGMVKLDEKALDAKLTKARTAYSKLVGKKGADKNALITAGNALSFARQEHKAVQMVKQIIANLKNNKLYANYTFYFNEQTGTYFIGIPTGKGDRYIDLTSGYEFNPDGSPRLVTSKVYYNKTTNNKNDILLMGQEEHDLFIAIFKGTITPPAKVAKFYSWTVNKITTQYIKATKKFDINYFVQNQVGDSGNVIYKSKTKEYLTYITPIITGEVVSTGTYALDETRKFSLLRYYRTQDGKEGGSYISDDADELDPVFIIWDGKPDMNLQQLYYKNNLITLSGKGNSFTGQYKENGQTRSINVTKVIKDHGKLVKSHYITINNGTKTFDFLYDTSILDPSLPVSCSTAKLKQQEEKIENLNWWKQCPGGWNLNIVADARGITRLVVGLKRTNFDKPVPPQEKSDAVTKAKKRGSIVKSNLGRIKYDADTNQYLYQLGSSSSDKNWAYYQPQWDGWYVDLANGILYSPNPAEKGFYFPRGSMQLSQLLLLLDVLELSVSQVEDPNGEPLYDGAGNPVMKDGKQVKGKPGIVYRSPTIVKDEKILNQGLVNLAKDAQKQQMVGK